MPLLRLSLLLAAALSLCSCGVGEVAYAVANPNDDDANLTAAMDIMVPPLLITGNNWPRSHDFDSPSHYTSLIRSRHAGRMTPDRANKTLDAMDEIFRSMPVDRMSDAQLGDLLGPPDKKVVQSGHTMYLYQFSGPQGLQGRWLVMHGR